MECDILITIITTKGMNIMTDSEKLDLLVEKVTGLDEKVTDLNERVTDLENNVTDIRLTLENEIRVNIQHVAEGHLDLSRKLNESIKLSSAIKDKQEIQDIYINMHNNKLKALQL